MASAFLSKLQELAKRGGASFYKWLGITSGSLGDIPGNHMNVGRLFLERGQAAEALKRFKIAAWMRPNSGEPHTLMVHAYAALGKKTEAQQAYNKANQLGHANLKPLKVVIDDIGKPPASETKTPEAEQPAEAEKVAADA